MKTNFRQRDPFRPVTQGWEVVISRWLIPAYFAGIALPGLGTLWIHLERPPGPLDIAQQKFLELANLMAIGMAVFDAAAVFTVALGCLIVTLMKGPARYADSMPPPAG